MIPNRLEGIIFASIPFVCFIRSPMACPEYLDDYSAWVYRRFVCSTGQLERAVGNIDKDMTAGPHGGKGNLRSHTTLCS